MAFFFADTSSVVKRYAAESGSAWVRAICQNVDDVVGLAEITLAEVGAMLSRAFRAQRISHEQRAEYVDAFIEHCDSEYELVPVSRAIIDHALRLTQRYKLRGYDAVQLACALYMNSSLIERGISGLTFLSADTDLVTAAISEGLPAANPNDH